MIIKVINSILIIIAIYLGFKHGFAMITGKQEIITQFSKWNFTKTGILILGYVTFLGAILIFVPKTFVWGNLLMATSILVIICFQLINKDLKSAAIEVPFLLLNLIIIYLQHPLKH